MGEVADIIEGTAIEQEAEERPGTELSTLSEPGAPAPTGERLPMELSVDQLVERRDKIMDAMERAMVEGVHYGKIPGISKPTLLKPGAEMLNVLFQLDPQYEVEERRSKDGHLDVTARCILYHAPTGTRLGSGLGLCTSRESKYAYRQGGRVCPECAAQAIIKGKEEYGGGWVCFKKKGGCGAKFEALDPQITMQDDAPGRVQNPDLPDTHNTVLKMACKRALVAADLNVTGASALFTQDVEDVAPEVARERIVDDAGKGRPVPKSFAEWTGRFAKLVGGGEPGKAEAIEWRRQALDVEFSVQALADLPREQVPAASVLLTSVLLTLEDREGDLAFEPQQRDVIARAFAERLEGKVLAGPPWRLGPAEDRPTYEAYAGKPQEDAGGDASDKASEATSEPADAGSEAEKDADQK